MKISQFVKELNKFKKLHGDIEVKTKSDVGGFSPAEINEKPTFSYSE